VGNSRNRGSSAGPRLFKEKGACADKRAQGKDTQVIWKRERSPLGKRENSSQEGMEGENRGNCDEKVAAD